MLEVKRVAGPVAQAKGSFIWGEFPGAEHTELELLNKAQL